jgi:hypothetical protein
MPNFGLQYSVPSSYGVLKSGVQDRFALYKILSSKFSVSSNVTKYLGRYDSKSSVDDIDKPLND